MKQKIKEEQKTLAKQIKDCRPLRKPRVFDSSPESLQKKCWKYQIDQMSWEFRHRHIVYCQIFNNTPYEKIERPRKGNEPSKKLLEKYRSEWEALRSAA